MSEPQGTFLSSVMGSAEFDSVIDLFHEVVYPAGEIFIEEGRPADSFYIILEGEVEVLKALGSAEERSLGPRTAGDFMGETALLDPEIPRTASVRALTPVKLLQLTQEDFDLLLPRHPHLALQLARRLSQRLRQSNDESIRDLQEQNEKLVRAYAELKAAQEQIVEKERLEHELQLARRIQLSILPAHLPVHPEVEFGAWMESARAVGGDLYDVIELEGSRFGLFIGDVSDKGVPASIFMALVRSLVRSEVCWACSPSEVLQDVNRHLLTMNEAGMFVTVIYGVYDPDTRHFFYARGGHEIPFLFAADGTPLHPTHNQGMMLGIFPDPPLDVQDLAIPPGGTLVLYTDGAFDAVNASGERFGKDRLKAAVEAVRGQSAQQVCDHILKSIHAFHGGVPQADDITLLVLKSR